MAYCTHCGQQIDEVDLFCPNCGADTRSYAPKTTPQAAQTVAPQQDDGMAFLWGLLGWFVPMAGLILFALWKDSNPSAAKAAGIGALVSVIMGVVLSFVVVFLYVFLFGMLLFI